MKICASESVISYYALLYNTILVFKAQSKFTTIIALYKLDYYYYYYY